MDPLSFRPAARAGICSVKSHLLAFIGSGMVDPLDLKMLDSNLTILNQQVIMDFIYAGLEKTSDGFERLSSFGKLT